MKFKLVLILLICSIQAYGWYPLVRNFDNQQYPGGAQNWCVTQSMHGMMLFGNRHGMLTFDGHRWLARPLPGGSTVRAILCSESDGRIYAGGSEEFGYFEFSSDGSTHFVSLQQHLPKSQRNFHEIWSIHSAPDGSICFRGDHNLYIYTPSAKTPSVKCLTLPERLTASAMIDGTLYVSDASGTIYTWRGSALHPLSGAQPIAGCRVVGIFRTPGGAPGFATSQRGLWQYAAGTMRHVSSPIDSFLTDNQVFCVTATGRRLAIGTVYAGAVEYDMATGKARYINKSTGLRDNTVLALSYDRADNLWLCLDSGLAYAMTSLPVTSLLGSTGVAGTGYASLQVGAHMLLGTNRALYAMPWPAHHSDTPPPLTKVIGGQIWSIQQVGTQILISSDLGLFQAPLSSPTAVKRVEGVPDSWSVIPLHHHPGYALASGYTACYLLRATPQGWVSMGAVKGYSDVGGRLTEDEQGDIWIPHWRKGLFRLTLDLAGRRFSEVKLYSSTHGLPSDFNNSIFKYGTHLLAITEQGLYSQRPDGNWVADPMSASLPLSYSAHLYDIGKGRVMALSQNQAMILHTGEHNRPMYHASQLTPSARLDSVSLRQVSMNINPGFDHVALISSAEEDALLISVQDGFYYVDMHHLSTPRWNAPLLVSAVYANTDSVIYRAGVPNSAITEKIPYSLNSLRFEFANTEFFDENAVLYSSRLKGYDREYSPFSTKPYREYTGVPEGRYTLQLKSRNRLTGTTSYCEFTFRIAPPWYRSIWAILTYILMGASAVYYGVKMTRNWSHRAERRMELRKDYEIAALKSAQLEKDIKHKSSELSSITMNVIRKNEILLDISSRLDRLQASLPEKSHTKDIGKIQSLIRENISHDDDWKTFNQNFDIVYEDFTRRLRAAHPSINANEQRICCYLKMGLNSKDIAPLVNISPRSVDMSRYRLRKKLDLPPGANLTSYLQNL